MVVITEKNKDVVSMNKCTQPQTVFFIYNTQQKRKSIQWGCAITTVNIELVLL